MRPHAPARARAVRLAREPRAPVIFSGDGTPENCKSYTILKLRHSRSQWYLEWLERTLGRLPTGALKSRPADRLGFRRGFDSPSFLLICSPISPDMFYSSWATKALYPLLSICSKKPSI